MTPPFTSSQIMLTLSFIAGAGALIDKNDCEAERELTGTINNYLQTMAPLKNDWELVWEPCVYKFPLIAKFTDNAVYLLQNTAYRSQYVIAISGTNPYEISDWLF